MFYILIENIPDIIIIKKLEPEIYHFHCKHNDLFTIAIDTGGRDRKNTTSCHNDIIGQMGDFDARFLPSWELSGKLKIFIRNLNIHQSYYRNIFKWYIIHNINATPLYTMYKPMT